MTDSSKTSSTTTSSAYAPKHKPKQIIEETFNSDELKKYIGSHNGISENVQNDILDIALINMEIPNVDKFHARLLLSEPLLYCVGRDHPFAEKPEIRLEMLDKAPLILYNQDSVQNRILQDRFSALDIQPRVIMRSSQITTILKFMKQGSCGCFLYQDMLPLLPEVTGIPLVPEIHTKAGVIWRRGRYINSGMQKFLNFCEHYYARK